MRFRPAVRRPKGLWSEPEIQIEVERGLLGVPGLLGSPWDGPSEEGRPAAAFGRQIRRVEVEVEVEVEIEVEVEQAGLQAGLQAEQQVLGGTRRVGRARGRGRRRGRR